MFVSRSTTNANAKISNMKTDFSMQLDTKERSILPSIVKPKDSNNSFGMLNVRRPVRPPVTHIPPEASQASKSAQVKEHFLFSGEVPYRFLCFSPELNTEAFKKHLMMIYKGLMYSTRSLKSPSQKYISSKQVTIPDPPSGTAFVFIPLFLLIIF